MNADAFAKLRFIGSSVCTHCGTPFQVDLGNDAHCLACLAKPPSWTTARAALRYDEASRGMILAFKHGGRSEGIEKFATWMGLVATDAMKACDTIAPAPLHWTRLATRGFNQAGELGAALGRRLEIRHDPLLLVRRRRTTSQGEQSASGRRRNVEGAFRVTPGRSVIGQSVLLVDDVMTTGATMDACARTLMRAGASTVHVLTLARVVRATRID
jgi:ComF family protein